MTNFARKVLNELPAPNVQRRQQQLPRTGSQSRCQRQVQHQTRSQIQRPAERLHTRVSHRKANNFEGPNIPGPSGSNQNGIINILNQQLVGGATYVFANASALDVRLGISRIEAGKKPPLTGGPSVRKLRHLPVLPEDRTITGGLTTQTINGYSQLGRQATNPQFQNPFNVNPRVNYSFTLGKHSLKAGYEYLAVNTDVQDANPLMAWTLMPASSTAASGGRARQRAAFTTGRLYVRRAFTQYEFADLLVVNLRRLHYAYLLGRFQGESKTDLEPGRALRIRHAVLHEAQNRQSDYDPKTNSIIRAKNGSLYDRAG
ncbi:MAG: hypothetical protein U0X75_27140 [Acidobacteriota bacterium]